MSVVNIRPATKADLEAMNIRLQHTSVVNAVEWNGELAGVTGYYLKNGYAVLISNTVEQARKRPGFGRLVLRCARALIEQAKQAGVPMIAAADPEIERSGELLQHIGFRHEYKETFSWRGQPQQQPS